MIKGVLIAFVAQSLIQGGTRSGNELLPLAGIAIFITAMLGLRELTAWNRTTAIGSAQVR